MNKNITEQGESTRDGQPFLKALINNSPFAVVQLDENHRIVGVNPIFEELFGYELAEIIGGNLDELLTTQALQKEAEEVSKRVTSGAFLRKVTQRKKKDGSLIDVEIFAVPVIVGEEIIGAFGLYHDISNQVKIERALRESEARYRSVTQVASDAVIIINSDGDIISWNKGAEQIFGYTGEEIAGKNLTKLMPETYQDGHQEGIDRVNSGGERNVIGKTVELEGVRKNGQVFPLGLSLSTWEAGGKKLYGGIIRDITERKQAEEKLRFMSFHDSLTGLYNRGYFDEEMSRLGESRQFPVSIIVCDMDDLKQINDTLGHDVGDRAIKGAASILLKVFRQEDVVARIGGDEFAVIVPNYDVNENPSISLRLDKAISDYNESEGDDGFYRPISISFGHSSIAQRESLVDGYKEADKQMYLNKAQKK